VRIVDREEELGIIGVMEVKTLERQCKALANERRLLILKELKRRHTASVGALAKVIHISLKATSKHLAILKAADILESRKRGLTVFYRLSLDQHAPVSQVLALL